MYNKYTLYITAASKAHYYTKNIIVHSYWEDL